MDSRRTFLARVAAMVAVGSAAQAAPAMSAADAERMLARLLDQGAGVAVGEVFHEDYWLLDAYPPTSGALVLVIAAGADGAALRVDVCRRGDPVRAPAWTDHLEFYVMDGGGGVKPEPQDLVKALWSLAQRLKASGADAILAPRLYTHQERLERYPEMMARASKELAPVGL
jgi:hypothetical protein